MSALSKRELVLNALSGKPVERVPVAFWHHYLNEDRISNFEDKPVYEEVLEGARRFKEEFDPDLVKIMTDGYFYLPIKITTRKVTELSSFKTVPVTDRWFQDQIKLAKGYREIYGKDILLFYNIFAPLAHLRYALGQGLGITEFEANELILSFIDENPDEVNKALLKIADNISELISSVVGEGLSDGIYLSVTDNNRFIPDALYRLYVSPSEKRVLDSANALSPHNILHICGWRGNTNYISLYQDYEAEAFNWAVNTENLSLGQGREFFGGKTVLGGFLNSEDGLLYKGTKGEIINAVTSLLNVTGRTGVILGADCTVPQDISVEHLIWAREAAALKISKIAV